MAKSKKTPEVVEATERAFAEPHFEAEQPEAKTEEAPAPVKSGYVYRLAGRHTKSGGQTISYLAGDPVVGLSSNEIMHFLSNGIIEPRKG